MKKAILGIAVIAGLATAASAATTITYQVREVGGTWGSSVDVNPGTVVEFRTLLSYTGATVTGLAGFNSQPTVSNWNSSTDTLMPFIASTGQDSQGVARNGASLNLDNAYGRRYFAQIPGVSPSNAYRGHTNNVSGVNYLRIAQNNTTGWIGTGPTSGTASANNWSGSGGIAVGQTNSGNVVVGTEDEISWPVPVYNGSNDGLFYVDNGDGTYSPYPVNPAWGEPSDDGFGNVIDPNPNPDANSPVPYNTVRTNLEVMRFALTIGGTDLRSLIVRTEVGAMLRGGSGGNQRVVTWYSGTGTGVRSDLITDSNIIPATINVVPTPGALALLGLGGLVAGRRRR